MSEGVATKRLMLWLCMFWEVSDGVLGEGLSSCCVSWVIE